MDYDKILIKLFWNNDYSTKLYRRFNQKINYYTNIYNYLLNRFDDSNNVYESLIRLAYNIYEVPKCPICGNPLKFIGKPRTKGIYSKHCSPSCRQKDTNVYKKQQQTSLEKYGTVNNVQQTLSTKLEKYGDKTFNNSEKSKLTNFERYGVCSVLQLDEIHNKGIESAKSEKSKEKRKNTNMKKFGGITPMSSDLIKDKVEDTKLKKYGNPTYNNRDKARESIINHYGYYYINSDKAKQTKLEKYGNENFNNKDKAKQTCLKKYGEISWSASEIGKKILSKILISEEVRNKVNITKKKNHTFNTSIPENESYKLLKEKYPDIQYQYKSDAYPYCCDFYIPSLDLYIECNYHWTHGGHPYNEQNEKDRLIIKTWKEKNTKYYDNAIITWTIRDIRKREYVKQNNLNYIEFWNLKELEEWLNKKDRP